MKSARQRPYDVDTLIDEVRRLDAEKGDPEMIDQAWTVPNRTSITGQRDPRSR
ncbi:MAG: hypothetical protein ACLP0J_06030 [Solirubrobacteraceae bacterium]